MTEKKKDGEDHRINLSWLAPFLLGVCGVAIADRLKRQQPKASPTLLRSVIGVLKALFVCAIMLFTAAALIAPAIFTLYAMATGDWSFGHFRFYLLGMFELTALFLVAVYHLARQA